MHELIYLEDQKEYKQTWEALTEEFPYAEVTDASDEIHPYRIQIRGAIAKGYFARWALKKRLFM